MELKARQNHCQFEIPGAGFNLERNHAPSLFRGYLLERDLITSDTGFGRIRRQVFGKTEP